MTEQSDEMQVPFEHTAYGFKYGSAEVTRIASHSTGWVMLEVRTPKGYVQVYATKTGKLRIWANGPEVQVPKP